MRLRIEKRIPVAAGMAGGSADAGAALRLVARAAGIDDDGLLREIAAELGADVAAQVRPRRYLATGVGERLTPLPPPAPYGVLVIPSSARAVDRRRLPRGRSPGPAARRRRDSRPSCARSPPPRATCPTS